MKERKMKIAKEMIKRGEGKHRYNGEQTLFRLSIEIPNESITKLIEKLKALSIVPRAIFKTERGFTIECGLWIFKWFLMKIIILD